MAEKKLSITRALALGLEKLGRSVFLRYDVARIAWKLYRTPQYENQVLAVRRATLDSRTFARIEAELLDSGIINQVTGAPAGSVYSLLGSSTSDRNEVACSIDPFCYVSHLSAMEFHGITDRIPEQLYLSTPPGTKWTAFAIDKMSKDLEADLNEFQDAGLPQLRRVNISKINHRPIHRHASVHLGAYRSIKNSQIRVSTLGRTFLEMLQMPELCGGLNHVLDVFQEHAAPNKRLIFDEIDQHGTAIDKVRAGFILEDLCHLNDERIDAWTKFAARGGSRKLDPSAEYSSKFSDRWCLSLNTSLPSGDH